MAFGSSHGDRRKEVNCRHPASILCSERGMEACGLEPARGWRVGGTEVWPTIRTRLQVLWRSLKTAQAQSGSRGRIFLIRMALFVKSQTPECDATGETMDLRFLLQ